MRLRVKWVDTAFDTLFTQVAAGRFDMAAAATTITPEREQQVNFSEPYYSAQQALVLNGKRSPEIRSVEDLSGGDVVAVQKGTTGEAWARQNVPGNRKPLELVETIDTKERYGFAVDPRNAGVLKTLNARSVGSRRTARTSPSTTATTTCPRRATSSRSRARSPDGVSPPGGAVVRRRADGALERRRARRAPRRCWCWS
jgi:membrane-bound lytic murein transglycosylase MltF